MAEKPDPGQELGPTPPLRIPENFSALGNPKGASPHLLSSAPSASPVPPSWQGESLHREGGDQGSGEELDPPKYLPGLLSSFSAVGCR